MYFNEITVTAKVAEIEQLSEDSNAITFGSKAVSLVFYQFDEQTWKKFLNEAAEKQKRISQIVKNIKS